MADVGAAPNKSLFLKQLASSSLRARSEALDHLRQYLRTRSSFTSLELLKLWKGLFYCVWHSDRPKAQQTLARDLAALTHGLRDDETTEQWLRAFWETMAREWDGIPALRMDKFLYLCRCYVGAGFEWARRGGWSEERLEVVTEVMCDVPLSLEFERKELTNGLRLHVLDVWVDVLDGLREDGVEMPLKLFMAPVMRLIEQSKDKTLRTRAKETLADERLKERQSQNEAGGDTMMTSKTDHGPGLKDGTDADAEKEEDDDGWGGFDEG